MERMLAEFRQESNRKAERPEFFWNAQQTAIKAKLRARKNHKGLGLLATAAATAAMVVFVAMPSRPPANNPQLPAQQAAGTQHAAAANIDDEALLESVNETTRSSVPDALAPANILASEMDRGLKDASKKDNGRTNQ